MGKPVVKREAAAVGPPRYKSGKRPAWADDVVGDGDGGEPAPGSSSAGSSDADPRQAARTEGASRDRFAASPAR